MTNEIRSGAGKRGGFKKMLTKKLWFEVPVVVNYSNPADILHVIHQAQLDLSSSDDLTKQGMNLTWKSLKPRRVRT